eukprot:403366492
MNGAIKIPLDEKLKQYYQADSIITLASKRQSINNSNRSSGYNTRSHQSPAVKSTSSRGSKRRDLKTSEKQTPQVSARQTPRQSQPFSSHKNTQGKAGKSNFQVEDVICNQYQHQKLLLNDIKAHNERIKTQNNMFFKHPSSLYSCNTRASYQKANDYQFKPSNYTVSTDLTTKNQNQDTTSMFNSQQTVSTACSGSINKRQRNQNNTNNNTRLTSERDDHFDTPFSNFGNKRIARQATQKQSLPPQLGSSGKGLMNDNFGVSLNTLQTSHVNNRKYFKTPERIFLEDQKNGNIKMFNVYSDEQTFPGIYQNKEFSLINMNVYQKQSECDYETDLDSLKKAKEILRKDLMDALDFFVKRDPLLLISQRSNQLNPTKLKDTKKKTKGRNNKNDVLSQDALTFQSTDDHFTQHNFQSIDVRSNSKTQITLETLDSNPQFSPNRLSVPANFKAQLKDSNKNSMQLKMDDGARHKKNQSVLGKLQQSRENSSLKEKGSSRIIVTTQKNQARKSRKDSLQIDSGSIDYQESHTQRLFSPQNQSSSKISLGDLQFFIKNGYRNKRDVLWEGMNAKTQHMMNKSFQTGLRNSSNLMTKIVKHITLDIDALKQPKQPSTFCPNSPAKSYRQPLGYQKRQGSQIPSFPSTRTLDVPDHKIAPTIPKSRGLRNLKAEIMKSSSVFNNTTKADPSRVPVRLFDLTQVNQVQTNGSTALQQSITRENLSATRQPQLGQEMVKHFQGHKDTEVNSSMGKPKNSNHVNAQRLKMFYTSQIKI